MSVTDEVKDRLDAVEVIGETVKLRKSGKNYTGFCPFHPNTRTPAFVVFPETGTWRCFGACNEGGDIFSFVMKKEGWDFPEALRYLAGRAGVELKPLTPAEQEQRDAHERLRELLETAVAFFRHNLIDTPAGSSVLDYLHARGLTDHSLEIFEIGYSPQSWDASMRFLAERGYDEGDMLDAGMITERESGGYYDRFRHRIMIPIRDARGRMAGFGARIVDPENVPKFLNSPQTPIFDKGALLYGLDKARKAIRQEDQAVVVEGYMDVIGLYQEGFENAVSPMGTAITEVQLRRLKRYSRRIILALDPDVAGQRATLRGLTLAREALSKEKDPVFDARGLVGYEGRLDADIRVVTLPPGMDPDEVVVEDRDAWPELLDKAQTVVEFVLETLSEGRDLEDPKVKAEIARQVLPLIEDVSDSVEREAYRQILARTLMVDERALVDWRPRRPARGAARRPLQGGEARRAEGSLASAAPDRLERFCLGVLLRDPELLYRVDRMLQSLDLDRSSELDFTGSERRMMFRMVHQALEQEEEEPGEHWRNGLDEIFMGAAEGLLEDLEGIELDRPRMMEEVLANFLRLRKRNQDAELAHLQFQLQALQEGEDVEGEEPLREMGDLKQRVRRLAQDRARIDSAIGNRNTALDSVLFTRKAVGWDA
jgi:DNA primase